MLYKSGLPLMTQPFKNLVLLSGVYVLVIITATVERYFMGRQRETNGRTSLAVINKS